jgi:hypothetical protein
MKFKTPALGKQNVTQRFQDDTVVCGFPEVLKTLFLGATIGEL